MLERNKIKNKIPFKINLLICCKVKKMEFLAKTEEKTENEETLEEYLNRRIDEYIDELLSEI